MMFKRLLNDKKGAAEVVGTVMFIVILMFFFTNVYLWHDAAVKEMNDLYAEKLNSQISIEDKNTDGFVHGYNPTTHVLLVKNNGGVDAIIECYWINHDMTEIPDDAPDSVKLVRAGTGAMELRLENVPANIEVIKVITTTGNIAKWVP
ncbi:MAG: hypothetical protein NWE96_11305 [Candidatus Bathyarchaeota archaeon]|nr:hypothetical protein [Candidatus Bathyarchaeota archaeon]